MSQFTTDPNVKSSDKVRCAICLSEVVSKNMKAHCKTQKHQIAQARLEGKGEIKEEPATPVPSRSQSKVQFVDESEPEVEDEQDDTEYLVECIRELGVAVMERIEDLQADVEWLLKKNGYEFSEEDSKVQDNLVQAQPSFFDRGKPKLSGMDALTSALVKTD